MWRPEGHPLRDGFLSELFATDALSYVLLIVWYNLLKSNLLPLTRAAKALAIPSFLRRRRELYAGI
jgi:hypothetical protein